MKHRWTGIHSPHYAFILSTLYKGHIWVKKRRLLFYVTVSVLYLNLLGDFCGPQHGDHVIATFF